MPNEERIGALWCRKSKKGTDYLTGNIMVNGQKIKIIAFKNIFKQEDKHPDWSILLKEDEKPNKQQEIPQFSSDDEIPF